jgi:ABC-type sulfate transport system permease subunit
MTDDPYKPPSVDPYNTVGRTDLRAILAVPIGVFTGVLTAVLVVEMIGTVLIQQPYQSVDLPVWISGVLAGIPAALFVMRRVNSRTSETGGGKWNDE